MAYEPTSWSTGDIVTAEKLNKLENGIASSGGEIFIVNTLLDEETGGMILDKTWQEIKDAFDSGKLILGVAAYGTEEQWQAGIAYLFGLMSNDSTHSYACIFLSGSNARGEQFLTNSKNGYPSTADADEDNPK